MSDKSEKKDRKKLIIWILLGVILILVLFILYLFVIGPAINNFIVEKQSEGYNLAISAVLNDVKNLGYVEIPISENQSVILVPYTAN